MNNPGENFAREALSTRELEILFLMADGRTNGEIAQELFLSTETVKWYNKQSYNKLGVGNRTEAVARAREYGLLDATVEKTALLPAIRESNLPAELTSFVGRQREIADVEDLLYRARLVTLTGPGGTGKTRLGLQVAGLMAENYRDGVIFISLAEVGDPSQIPNVVAREVGVIERPDRQLVDTLQSYLRSKQMLLILDNFEHVLEAAPLVVDLLVAAPNLAILATSRENLHLSGEHEYLVPPMTLPDPDEIDFTSNLADYESVNLFVQRAKASMTKFQLTEKNAPFVVAICQRLDGLPLAIELAAARIKMFGPQQMLARLENRFSLPSRGSVNLPERQRTLHNTIEWSYNLLDKDQQRLFSRLGIFRGGHSIEAAEVVCGFNLSSDIVSQLESLLDKNLLYQDAGHGGETRFFMLKTIREYARYRLIASEELRLVQDKHLSFYVSMAEDMEPGYWHQNQLRLFEYTEAEMSNLRAAYNWAMESGKIESAARLISSIDYYLRYVDHLVEGYRWYQQVLDLKDVLTPARQVRLLLGAARMACVHSQLLHGKLYCQDGLVLARELGDERMEAWLLIQQSVFSIENPDEHVKAVKICQEAIAKMRTLDDKPGMAFGYNILGELARAMGDYDRAREVYDSTLEIIQETGEKFREIMMLVNLAFLAYWDGDYERAKELAGAHLRQMVEIGARHCVVEGLALVAGPLGQLKEAEKAARLLGAFAALTADIGVDPQPGDVNEIARFRVDIRSHLDEATFAVAWEEGQSMTMDQAVAYALT